MRKPNRYTVTYCDAYDGSTHTIEEIAWTAADALFQAKHNHGSVNDSRCAFRVEPTIAPVCHDFELEQ